MEAAPSSEWIARIDAERALAERSIEHRPRATEDGVALGPFGRLSDDGAHLALETGGEITVELAAMGRSTMHPTRRDAPSIAGPEGRIVRAPGVTEWWRSLPSGLEQGITITDRPSGTGSLRFVLEVRGATPSLDDGDVAMRDASGEVLARYAHLMVRDADGASVPARLAVHEGRIRIDVDDGDARYPIVVDPLLYTPHEAMLTASVSSQGRFGSSIATNADGSRMVVGASFDRSARVFVRTGTTWTAEATLRDPMAPATAPNVGTSVGMSADGATVVVGAPLNTGGGQAVVFVRSGSTWTLQQRLSRPGGAVGDRFGDAVAIDGSRIAVGAPSADGGGVNDAGAAHVFTRSGSTWSHLVELVPPARAVADHFGDAIAISGSSWVIVGAPDAGSGGVAYLFAGTGLHSTTYAGASGERLGISVAMSGNHCLIGYDGGARYYDNLLLTGSSDTLVPSPGGVYGISVALTSLGGVRLALIGGPNANTGASRSGGAALFRRSGSTWSTPAQASLLASPTPGVDDFFGSSVALAGDGTRAFVGAPSDDDAGFNSGTAHVFRVAIGLALGTDCTENDQCLSGFCADGVCCNTACDLPDDCTACAAELTGETDGTCAALSAAVAPTISCRAPVGGLCDAEDFCIAGDPVCPDDRQPSGFACRPSLGPCDQTEVCDGVSATCPGDAVTAAGIVCRSDMGPCDIEEVCDGVSGTCPADVVEPADTPCRAAVGDCDVADVCDGRLPECVDSFREAGFVCDPSVTGVCDAPDVCTGSTGNCPRVFLAGVECRASTASCDAPEFCSGAEATCPPDSLTAAGLVCRASIDPECDPSEACTGVSSACPADLNMCVFRDGGVGDGGDAGPAAPATGCSCRVASSERVPPSLLGLALLGLALLRRRR